MKRKCPAVSSTVLCVGCGTDVTKKTADHRNLDSDCSNEVADLWKDIVSSKVSEETELEPRFWRVINAVRNHRMCRQFFTNYTSILKLEKTIVENLNNALIPANTERMSYVLASTYSIGLLPYPVGKAAKASFPTRRLTRTSVCFTFNSVLVSQRSGSSFCSIQCNI